MSMLGHRVTLITAPRCGVCDMDCSEGKPGRSEACPEAAASLAVDVLAALRQSKHALEDADLARGLKLSGLLAVERIGIVCDMLHSLGLAECEAWEDGRVLVYRAVPS